METELLLTQKEAAEMLRITQGTLRVWACYGKHLPVIKLGGAVRYRLSDVQKFIADSEKLPKRPSLKAGAERVKAETRKALARHQLAPGK